MTKRQDGMEIERFKTLIEEHGGDPSRWPETVRAPMMRLASQDPIAGRLLAEARALDRLLDSAPTLDADRLQGLSQRIVAAAVAEGRWPGQGEQKRSVGSVQPVVNQRAAVDGREFGAGHDAPQSIGRSRHALPAWLAGGFSGQSRGALASFGMLAASLVFGVTIGLSATTGDVTGNGSVAGTQVVADASDDSVLQQLVSGEESLDQILEDLL